MPALPASKLPCQGAGARPQPPLLPAARAGAGTSAATTAEGAAFADFAEAAPVLFGGGTSGAGGGKLPAVAKGMPVDAAAAFGAFLKLELPGQPGEQVLSSPGCARSAQLMFWLDSSAKQAKP